MAWMYINFSIGQTLRDLQVPHKALPTTQRWNQKPTQRHRPYPKWQWHSQTFDLDDGTCCNPHPHLQLLENNLNTFVRKRHRQPTNWPITHHSFIQSWLQPPPRMVFIERFHPQQQKSTPNNRSPRRWPPWPERDRPRYNQKSFHMK